MTPEQLWSGEFGDAYTKRNMVPGDRRAFWKRMMEKTKAHSVFEIGANIGVNLAAIKDMSDAVVSGNDANGYAVDIARSAGLDVWRADYMTAADLVFTCGVLIHQDTPHLLRIMAMLAACAREYALMIEYLGEFETEIEYRGKRGVLFKRDFGAIFDELAGWPLEETGYLGEDDGFDACTYWLFRRKE